MARVLLLVAVFLVTFASPARAGDDATLTTIRALGAEGEALFDKGAYGEALDRFVRIDAMLKRHTIGVYIGRCLENLGRLNEASERYLAVTRMELPPELGAPQNAAKLKLQEDARANAEDLRAKLLPRIPAIVLQVDAPPGARVSIDGAEVAAALFGVKRSTDPGSHVVEASAGASVLKREITLREGEVLTVPIELHAAPGVAEAPRGTAPSGPGPGDASTGTPSRARGTLAVVGIGVGVAGIVVGAVATGLALANKSDLDKQCGPDLHCTDPGTEHLVSTYNTERVLSTVGFVVGVTALAGGVTLALTAPTSRPVATLSVFAGLSGAGVKGRF